MDVLYDLGNFLYAYNIIFSSDMAKAVFTSKIKYDTNL